MSAKARGNAVRIFANIIGDTQTFYFIDKTPDPPERTDKLFFDTRIMVN